MLLLTTRRAIAAGCLLALLAALTLSAARPQILQAEEPAPGAVGETQLVWLNEPQRDADGRLVGAGAFRWGGGSWYALDLRLQGAGCGVQALYLPEQRLGWHAAAPAFINRPFTASYGANEPIVTGVQAVMCAADPVQVSPGPPEPELKRTHLRWLLRPEVDTDRNKQGTATIQYGGGSFYQLISRLSIEGCETINLKIDDLEYDFRNTNAQNQDFKDAYTDHIQHNATIAVQCIDNCDVVYGLNLVPIDRYRYYQGFSRCSDIVFSDDDVISYTDCTTDWPNDIQELFLRIPVFQNICKIRYVSNLYEYGTGSAVPSVVLVGDNVAIQHRKAAIVLVGENGSRDVMSFTTMHEICHVHQSWYTMKQLIDNNYLRYNEGHLLDDGTLKSTSNFWYETDMAREFIGLVGFEHGEDETWRLAGSKVHPRSSYVASDPIELSADICALHLLKTTDIENKQYERFTLAPYLTDELEAWVEKYIVLPE